jgi:hypothetical protein
MKLIVESLPPFTCRPDPVTMEWAYSLRPVLLN